MEQNKHNTSRRSFITTSTKAAGASLILSPYIKNFTAHINTKGSITVGDIMDKFIAQVNGAPFKETVDTLKAGNRDIQVTGIVTTMFATIEVIRKAIELNANFIIAHEPTYYNHLDETDWLQGDSVYTYKANLLKQHNIAVWRNHDYIHSLATDGVFRGVVEQLGWQQYYKYDTSVATIPSLSLQQLINHAKSALGISMVRYVGDLKQPCSKVLLMPGAAGGKRQIEALSKYKPDVLMCGEIQEWETAEYVRDARLEGENVSLVVLGHIASEEAGSTFMVNWLKQNFAAIQATHVPAKNSLSFA